MIAETTLPHVDLWDAWIDLQTKENIPMLYVMGNVCTVNRNTKPRFIKKAFQEANVLVLEIDSSIAEEGYENEIMHAEELTNIDQYKSVYIYANRQLVARILELEVLA
jgi:hypothetical protein